MFPSQNMINIVNLLILNCYTPRHPHPEMQFFHYNRTLLDFSVCFVDNCMPWSLKLKEQNKHDEHHVFSTGSQAFLEENTSLRQSRSTRIANLKFDYQENAS